jgi:DNA-binding transcriptional ArsR family regulator
MLSKKQRVLYNRQHMNNSLATLFGGQTKARILEVLASRPGETFHLRGLAHAAGIDSGNASRILGPLVRAGVVHTSEDGRATRYALNDRSPMARPLRELVAAAGAFMGDLRAAAQALEALYVGIFGSVAQGTDDAHSDVDVLVVGPASSVQAQAAFKAVGRKYRRTINTIAVTREQLTEHLGEGGAFWSAVASNPRIDIQGDWPRVANPPDAAA